MQKKTKEFLKEGWVLFVGISPLLIVVIIAWCIA